MSDYDLAMREEELNIQRAEANGDTFAARTASQNLAGLRVQRSEYVAMSHAHAASLRPETNAERFGLSAAEAEHAKISGVTEQEYAKNKSKLAGLRQRGEYPAKGHG
jgi:phage I-like protein